MGMSVSGLVLKKRTQLAMANSLYNLSHSESFFGYIGKQVGWLDLECVSLWKTQVNYCLATQCYTGILVTFPKKTQNFIDNIGTF